MSGVPGRMYGNWMEDAAVEILRIRGARWSSRLRWEAPSYFKVQAENVRGQEGTYAWVINQDYRVVPANVVVEQNRL